MSEDEKKPSRVASVWKFELPDPGIPPDEFILPMPTEHSVLDVQLQCGRSVLWAVVDPEAEPTPAIFRWVSTGEVLPEDGRSWHYVATVQFYDGEFVGHLFKLATP